MSETVTEGIRVKVRTQYLADRSRDSGRYVFAYNILIANEGEKPAQLISRHWIITDALGHEEHVEGEGVVGRKPFLKPGEATEYQSFCPLTTPHGSMRGTYRMLRPDGSQFDAVVAPFTLAVPHSLN